MWLRQSNGASVHVRTCTLHLFFGSWLEKDDSRWMILEFLELTFSRHDTCNLLCDTSLALARSSPTRRYTGIYRVSQKNVDSNKYLLIFCRTCDIFEILYLVSRHRGTHENQDSDHL